MPVYWTDTAPRKPHIGTRAWFLDQADFYSSELVARIHEQRPHSAYWKAVFAFAALREAGHPSTQDSES
jgi:hypothetical protein